MTKNKTTETTKSVTAFIHAVKDETKRNDSFQIIDLITKQTGLEPKLWGPSIVGFGSYHYHYESGREGDAPLIGFSPRSTAIVFYLSSHFEKRDELLQSLGKHKTGGGCIYIKRLKDINAAVLKKMISKSVKQTRSLHPETSQK
jgi:hypothetical protein